MKAIDNITKTLCAYLEGKNILEIACGDSDFSISASKYAEKVLATDISLDRFKCRGLNNISDNIEFLEMSADALDLEDGTFDAAVCYNALGHLIEIIPSVFKEMVRVVKTGGLIVFASTWKMDRILHQVIEDLVILYDGLEVSVEEKSNYSILLIKKTSV
ncbi:MAG: class I SAM-dependent methyltransferase [Bacillota bacterium]